LGRSDIGIGSDVVEEDDLYKKVAGHLSLGSTFGVIWLWKWYSNGSIFEIVNSRLGNVSYLVERPLNVRKIYTLLGVHLSLRDIGVRMCSVLKCRLGYNSEGKFFKNFLTPDSYISGMN